MPRYYIERTDAGNLIRDHQDKTFRIWVVEDDKALMLLRRLNAGEEARRKCR